MKCQYGSGKRCITEVVPGRKMCKEHLNRINSIVKRIYKHRIESGLCTRCGHSNTSERKYLCDVCAAKDNMKKKNIKNERKRNGICTHCKSEVYRNKTKCLKHLMYYSRYMKTYKENHLVR